MNFICLDGKFYPADQPVFKHDNRSYRYGDGLFETMKTREGRILLVDFHFERLFSSLSTLNYRLPALFTRELLEQEITQLCRKNAIDSSARIRFSVSRGNGGLNDEGQNLLYLIEAWPLNESVNSLNENGLDIGIYPYARKSTDRFSNIKSANFLPYSLAALYAGENKLNDCLVLNTKDHIADATVANVFLIRNQEIFTPALTEGCVNGVMRRWLLEKCREGGYTVRETVISEPDLLLADEVFLTNAIHGIKWVGRFGDKKYKNELSRKLYNDFIRTIL